MGHVAFSSYQLINVLCQRIVAIMGLFTQSAAGEREHVEKKGAQHEG